MPIVREELLVLGEIAGEVAHELRNALAVIGATAPLLRTVDATQREAHIAKIERNARLAQGVLDAVMALARGDELGGAPVRLADAVREARLEVKGTLEYRDDVPAEASVRGSAILLARMFRVLYENAAEAGARTVTTKVLPSGTAVVVLVSDDGPGVPPDQRATLFDPLVTGKAHGTGLGLALARRVARAHRGDITVESAQTGACFRIELRR